MAYQLFYGNPFAAGGGSALAELGREREGFARAVENAKIRLEEQRVDLARAAQRLAESREQRIKRQTKEQMQMQRDQIAQGAEEFKARQALRERHFALAEAQEQRMTRAADFDQQKYENELRDLGFAPLAGRRPTPDETVLSLNGRQYVGPSAAARRAEEIEQARAVKIEEKARIEKNQLRQRGWTPLAEDSRPPPQGYATYRTVDGETWTGRDAAAAAAAKQQAELAEFEAKERIKAEYKKMQNSDEYTPRQKSYLRGLEKDSEGLLDSRGQALKEREEIREEIDKLDTRLDNAGLSGENLSAPQRKQKQRLEQQKADLEKRLKSAGTDDYDARIEARKRVRNAIMANPAEPPPVSLDWLRGVDWLRVAQDGKMATFSAILRLEDKETRQRGLELMAKQYSAKQ